MAALVFDKKDAVNIMKQSMQAPSSNHLLVASSQNVSIQQLQQQQQPQANNHHLKNFAPTTLKIQQNSMSSTVSVSGERSDNKNHNQVTNSNVELLKENSIKTTGVNCLSNFKGYISEASKKKIADIIADIGKFNDIEKLYLYLQLPDGSFNNEDNDAKKKSVGSPFGKKADSEVIQTYAWIQSHLEEDISVSIPKQEVYEEYKAFCEANKFEKLCVADFGKAMKHIFPHVKPRRLGQRGNSKYCYSGLRKKIFLNSPELPIIDMNDYNNYNDEQDDQKKLSYDIVWSVILEWVEKTMNRKFKTSIDFARFLIETQNIKSELANTLTSNNNGSSQTTTTKANVSKSSSNGKKENFIQINNNKKLIEKKKSEMNNSNRTNGNERQCTNGTIAQNFNINNKMSNNENFNSVIISSKPTAHLVNVNPTSTSSSQNCITTKIEIPDNETVPMCNSKTLKILLGNNQQAMISQLPVATAYSIDPQIKDNGSNKYKPIQPKPVNFENRFQRQINNNVDDRGNTNTVDKRRNSLSTSIFNVDPVNNIKKEFDDELNFNNLNKPVNDNDKNYKRQMDEKDFNYMAKKRHVENISNIQQQQNSCAANTKSDLITTNDTCDLKLNDLENEALNEYLNNGTSFSDNNDCKDDNFIQIRKILENHLPKDPNNPNSFYNNNNNQDNRSFHQKPNKHTNNSFANFDSKDNQVENNLNNNLNNKATTINNNNQLQIASPNARRNAFSFQPISPHTNTPTIPENSALEMNVFSNNNKMNSMQCKKMASVSVGPSQPSSEANSPFVSPRNTPISFGGSLSRSRNNSGQSAYSNYRQTPLQNFDSGVSSISSSPFISPQSTPIPSIRMRPIDNGNNLNRNVTARVRHSSGPGGPVNRAQITGLMAYNRSNSLSPMIVNENNSNNNCFGNQNYLQSSQLAFNNLMNNERVRDIEENNNGLNQKLSAVTQTDPHTKESNSTTTFHFMANDNNNLLLKSASSRQRHFSNPYGGVSTAMVKNDDNLKMLLNRSQSVPLHQMFESNTFDSTALMKSQMNDAFNNTANQLQSNADSSLMPVQLCTTNNNNATTANNNHIGISKSYPATPLCSDNFNELSTVNTSNMAMNDIMASSLDDLLNNNNDNVIQSGQDLIVSSVHLNPNVSNDNNTDSNQPGQTLSDLNDVSSPMIIKDERNDFSELLINDNDVEQFQSLDAFQDCDNDFSNIDLDTNVATYDGGFSV